MTSSHRTAAQLYALIFGVLLLAVGVLGFIVDATFGNIGSEVEGSELVIFEVNGWHNIVHIASGALGLSVAPSAAGSRLFALGFGAVYLAVTVWGFITGDSVIGLIPVNTADNFLHLAIAVAGIAAGLASPSASDTSEAAV